MLNVGTVTRIAASGEEGADGLGEEGRIGGCRAFDSRIGRGGCCEIALVDPCADGFDLLIAERIATHGHALRVSKAKDTFDEEAIGTFTWDDGGAGTAAAEKSGFGAQLQFAHGGVTQVTLGAGLLKNGENVFFKGNFRSWRLGGVDEADERDQQQGASVDGHEGMC